MNPTELRGILDRRGLHLRKNLGQNFLIDEMQAARLVEVAGVEPEDRIIEVGSGLGCLTRALADRADRVISVEIDSGLVLALREESLLPDNVELIHDDALRIDLEARIAELESGLKGRVRFVANLPYSVATPMLRRLLDLRHRLADWSVMLQREVGERLFAEVGCRDYGSFAVLHHLCAELRASKVLSARCFFPVPAVDSLFVRIGARSDTPLMDSELSALERVARAAFGKRRKTISNSLRGGGFPADRVAAALAEAKIDPGDRSEKVEPERLLDLARALTRKE